MRILLNCFYCVSFPARLGSGRSELQRCNQPLKETNAVCDNAPLILHQFQAHVHGALAGDQSAVHGGNLGSDALLHCAPPVDQLGEEEGRSARGKNKNKNGLKA